MAANEVDDVPPLEDMSELLQRVDELRDSKTNTNTPKCDSLKDTQPAHNNKMDIETCKTVNNVDKKTKGGFGGMKKGFLFGSSKKTSSNTKARTDAIPLIKPSSNVQSSLNFPEVQDALTAGQKFTENTEWVTDNLLQKITQNPTLAKRLTDPAFMQAITEFQSNPQAAMTKYAGNAVMQDFLKEFCGILGSHFNGLADTQENSPHKTQASSSPPQPPGPVIHTSAPGGADIKVHDPQGDAEDAKVRRLLADPEIRDILLDERIREFIRLLKTKPDEAQRVLQVADSGLRQKIHRLAAEGVLSFKR